MSKTKKILATTSLFVFLGMFFIFTSNANAITYEAQIGFGKISGKMTIGPDSIGLYITEVYKYAVSVAGIVASIVLMWGGVRWLTAGGDKGAVDDAKKWIEGALSGLVLVMTSYMILYFVNPDLIKFKSIKIDPIKESAKVKEAPADVISCCVVNYVESSFFSSTPKRICFENIKTSECNLDFVAGTSAAGKDNISTETSSAKGGSCEDWKQPQLNPKCE